MGSHIPLDVVALSLLTAVLWGYTPIIEKRGMSLGGTPLQASIVVVTVDSAMYWAALALLSGDQVPFTDVSLGTIALFLLAGVIGTALGRLSLYVGLDRVGASVNNAVVNTRPLFAAILGIVLLGEPATPSLLTGVALIVAGLVVLSLAKGGDIAGWSNHELAFPLLAALGFAVGNVIRRFGLATTPTTALEAVALNETAGLIALAGYAVAYSGENVFDGNRRTFGFFAVSGVLTGISLLSLFEALSRGRVSIVDPLYGTSPLFTTVFAYFFLRDLERVTVRIVVGALVVVAGVVVLTAL